jgi:hypothetical protein
LERFEEESGTKKPVEKMGKRRENALNQTVSV